MVVNALKLLSCAETWSDTSSHPFTVDKTEAIYA